MLEFEVVESAGLELISVFDEVVVWDEVVELCVFAELVEFDVFVGLEEDVETDVEELDVLFELLPLTGLEKEIFSEFSLLLVSGSLPAESTEELYELLLLSTVSCPLEISDEFEFPSVFLQPTSNETNINAINKNDMVFFKNIRIPLIYCFLE